MNIRNLFEGFDEIDFSKTFDKKTQMVEKEESTESEYSAKIRNDSEVSTEPFSTDEEDYIKSLPPLSKLKEKEDKIDLLNIRLKKIYKKPKREEINKRKPSPKPEIRLNTKKHSFNYDDSTDSTESNKTPEINESTFDIRDFWAINKNVNLRPEVKSYESKIDLLFNKGPIINKVPIINRKKVWKYANKSNTTYYEFTPEMQSKITEKYLKKEPIFYYKLKDSEYVLFFNSMNQISDSGIVRKVKYD